ncbi:putative TetR-family transcriptional regulator [Actinoplanes missouriensis 431]|uniref:Putative TetR-family transcriptional regulator n=1 Tax=Actinoplanes missouriensis (strain ATCC 14538 / DSM 43046 / CBS 188.64 / JCM 3121 / NBRC 102363 / NCIMB 12654 / NRRL B-3342 / UNCC 431) TaxID=512565 RepID=I0H6V8_ACTM4|nr:TetR/AcrR family transcriptional regulator [Actinoplanes missouriensis]BAL88745.1 putative TetR-family transcriptional regulator [Actinoplanes missouriensis 431]
MPKIVNHDQRRAEIVEAYLTVVARDGLPAATSRAIAAELGVGVGTLWHYFDGFDAVAAGAYQRIVDRTNGRIASATAGRRGLDALYAMFREILPLQKETFDEAYVVVGFWGRLAANDRIAATWLDVGVHWGELMRRHLGEAVDDGTLRPETPIDQVIGVLQAIAAGQQVHAVMGKALADPAHRLDMVTYCLRPWQ